MKEEEVLFFESFFDSPKEFRSKKSCMDRKYNKGDLKKKLNSNYIKKKVQIRKARKSKQKNQFNEGG